MEFLLDNEGRSFSTKEIAREVGSKVGRVNRSIRRLKDWGLIEQNKFVNIGSERYKRYVFKWKATKKALKQYNSNNIISIE